MNVLKISFCFCLYFLFFNPASRAGTLAQWLDSIDDVNPSVLAAHGRWQAAQSMVAQVAGLPDPMIGVNVERNNTRFSDYMGLEYMIEQEVPWPGRLRTDREVARLEAEAVGFDYLEVRRQAKSKITSAAWKLWAARKAADITRAQEALAESLVSTMQARFESAQGGQTELFRLQIELERIRNQTITMDREAEVALARLNEQLNSPPQTPRATDDMPPLPELIASMEQMQENARLYCCVLMATLWREMARDLERKSATLEQRPNVSFIVVARQFRDSGGIDEVNTGVAMNFPWLWRGKYKGRIAGAEAEYLMAQAMLEEEIAMTLTEIQELYTDAQTRLRTLRLYEEKILPQAGALADASRNAYISGTLPVIEMIDSQRMLYDAQMTLYLEKAAYAEAYARLMATAQPWTPDEFDTGLPLHSEEIP